MAAAGSAPTPGPSPGATRTSLGEGGDLDPRYGNRGYGGSGAILATRAYTAPTRPPPPATNRGYLST